MAPPKLNPVLLSAVRVRTLRMIKHTLDNVSKLTDASDMSVLVILKEDMMEKWTSFASAFEAHEEYLTANDDRDNPELPTITDEFIAIHSQFLTAKTLVHKLLAAVPPVGNIHNSTLNPLVEERRPKPACKLPPVRITPFAGDSGDWIEFKATCSKVLTEDMPDFQKLQHLKDALIGEPRNLVGFVMPNEGAYDKAMELLQNRYENFRKIINDQLRKFFDLPSITTPSAEAFRAMLNVTNGLLATLQSCHVDTQSWDAIVIFVLTQKFDVSTLEIWEEKLNGKRTIPPLKTFLEFLETRIIVRSGMDSNDQVPGQSEKQQKSFVKPPQKVNSFAHNNKDKNARSFFTLKAEYKCVLCGKNHLPSRCDEIVRISAKERHTLVKQNNLCYNCFYPHAVRDCPFNPACKRCPEPHHTLLHLDGQKMYLNMASGINDSFEQQESSETNGLSDDTLSQLSAHHFYHIKDDDDALLATAMVPVRCEGRSVVVKTLVDQGSTANLITIRACRLLNLRFPRNKSAMLGVGNTPVGCVIGRARFEIGSVHNPDFKLIIIAIVVRSIGEVNGVKKEETSAWKHLIGLPLADPQFYEANHVDMLLGSAAHGDIIMDGLVKGNRNEPIAQRTELGWIVSGHIDVTESFATFCRLTTLDDKLDSEKELCEQLKAFWELEEVKYTRHFTIDEQMAEEIFKNSVKRTADGKFVVDLPFKKNPLNGNCFGESRSFAEKRYKSLQRRLEKNPQLKIKYDEVLEEYLTFAHMELVENRPELQYFLPHHYVVKETSSTTKVRNVFDASAKSSNGMSLNDNLYVGATIQPELFELLIQWRKYEFALSGDIEKMYRMFWVNPIHANFQTILWQRPGTDSIEEYRLLTITFGTSSAPFQAIRCVYEIGEHVKETNAQLAEMIQKCFYVDDFLKSFTSIESAVEMREFLTETLAEYGLRLRKWKSNDERTLANVDCVDKEPLAFDSTLKTLGISWQPSSDVFVFKPSETIQAVNWTKRKILSEVAELFDPLGWLAPCIIRAKILLQDIWHLPRTIEWDSELPAHIVSQWVPIVTELIAPIPIQIPRWLRLSNRDLNVEIYGFCDAANSAYDACVYLRVTNEDGTTSCNLVAAKSKVAPVRAVTIPRLELCGAVLLAKLLRRCCQALSLSDCRIQAWSDSKIVLAWISTHPSKWSTFVANRVSEIQQTCEAGNWLHIPTKLNPADIGSRGMSINELKDSSLWWNGPKFLFSTSEQCPSQNYNLPIDTAPEKKRAVKIHHVHEPKHNYVLEYFSTSFAIHGVRNALAYQNHKQIRFIRTYDHGLRVKYGRKSMGKDDSIGKFRS
ncbi:uncharacterized protein LOC129570356 [Sitodiplosis mosellana]|uniref:uncharacterized protein LOC129570356 n=1 Tax=Sitodiplosis mosellana TaxID=263140 RepID=UPI002444CCFB|nr:uncharacterized protein LOC129570356 [Sitodiplosis mosellana]